MSLFKQWAKWLLRDRVKLAVLTLATSGAVSASDVMPDRPLWGDTHLHTSLSGDAIAFGLLRTPADAYDIALGKAVKTSDGQVIKLTRPMDFLVVADHAEGYGLAKEIQNGNQMLLADETIARWAKMMRDGENIKVGREMITAQQTDNLPEILAKKAGPLIKGIWEQSIKTTDRYNQPGKFTAFHGFEWSSAINGNNLHRVVVFRDGGDKVGQIMPLDSNRSGQDPENLWRWLDKYQGKTGGKVLAIPHNGNLSNGIMFPLTGKDGQTMDKAYAEQRSLWEPLYETTQIKGDGEAHPLLSPNDEFADFETWDNGNINGIQAKSPDMVATEYSREALKNGLKIEQQTGANPYKFGLIGSTDAHTAVTASEESNFWGKFAAAEPGPGRWVKHRKPSAQDGWEYAAAGLAAVWAEENTRESIFDAMRRRETYATTGSRISLRFFAGWDFGKEDVLSTDYAARGYRKGVPMGGDLSAAPKGKAPSLMISASMDPLGGNLDRLQVVKGWVDSQNQTHEKVYDVAWSGERVPGADGKLPPVGNTVDVADASWTNSIGSPELATVWTDPDFDASQRAFYYVRVLEIPTPRWTAYDAKRYNAKPDANVPMTIQERAYSSPIWYTP